MQSLAVRSRAWWALAAVVFVIAIATAGVGIVNGFTYDDQFVIVHNTAIDALPRWWKIFTWPYWPPAFGGDGYRPLTILGFAIEWAIGRGTPLVFHAINIVAYGLASVAVFWLASMLMPAAYAACAGALFAVHPVHVEAVANVVGQSEVVVGGLAVLAAALYLRWRNAGVLNEARMAGLVALYFVACFAKENAIMIPALLFLVEVFAVEERAPFSARFARTRPLWLALMAAGLAFLLVRSLVLPTFSGFQLYVPFEVGHTSRWLRTLTMLDLVPQLARLLFWPAHLQTEYGPPEYPIADGVNISQLPGLLIVSSLIGLIVSCRTKAPGVSLGLAWAGLAFLPVSNILVPTGILIAERTLFLPSVGVVLAIGSAMPPVAAAIRLPRARVAAFAGVLCLIAAGLVRSAARTRVWRDNETLFTAAVVDAPYSYRSHYLLGGWRFAKKRVREGEHEVLLALKLYPQEPFVTYNLGEEYRKAGMFEPAARMFQRSLEITPNYKDGLERLAMCLANLGRLQEAAGPAAGAMRQGAKEWKVMRDILIAAGEERRHIRGGAGSLLPRAADSSAGREPSRSRILPELPQNAPPDSIGNRTALRNLL